MATTNYWREDSADFQASPWTALKTGQPTTPAAQNWASAKPVASTPAVASAPAAPASDFNYWSNVNGVNMPNFTKDDWQWKDYNYTPGQWNANAFGATGDSGPIWEDEKVESGGWMLTDAARERLRAGGWDLSNRNNMAFNMNAGRNGLKGSASPEWMGNDIYDANYTAGGDNGYNGRVFNKERTDAEYAALKAANPLDFIRDAMYKTGEKEGQAVKYRRDGDRLVAVNAGSGEWDTNIGNRNRNVALGKAALAIGSAGLAAPAMAAAQAGTGILGTGLTLGQIGTGVGFINSMSGGQAPYLSEIGMATSLGGNIGSLADGISNGVNSVGDALKLGQAGYGALSKGANIYNRLTGPDSSGGRTNMPYPGQQYQTNQPYNGGQQQQSNNWSFLDPLMRMGAGAYSEHQNRDAFTGLNDLFSRQERNRQPFVDKLNESYTNPNAYLQSPEGQALHDIESNRLARLGASAGRNANDIDQRVLLQRHAQKGLADYRQGLTSSINANTLPYQIFQDASTRTGNAGGAAFGGIGYGGMNGPGGSGGVSGAVNGIGNIINGVGGAFRSISDMFGGGGGFDFNPNGGNGFSYGDFDQPSTGAPEVSYGNTFEMPGNWNWDDMDSWDINSFFDNQAGGNFWGIE